jgi:hypothetical protein
MEGWPLRCMHCRCCLGVAETGLGCVRETTGGGLRCVASHTSTGAATEAAVLEGTKERQEFKRQGARYGKGEQRE